MLKPNIMANILSAVLIYIYIYINKHVFNLNIVYNRWKSGIKHTL